MADYATETDVYAQTGFTTEMVQRVTEKDAAEVTTLINGYLDAAEAKVKDLLDIPHLVPRELHLGDGESDEFDLGPEDECVYFDEPVENLVVLVQHCFFGRKRMKRPLPKDCDEYTETAADWDTGAAYVQPTDETTIVQAGVNSMKFDFTGGILKARYPDVTNDVYIQKNIDMFEYMFARVQSDTNDVTLTVRLYDKNDNAETTTYLISKKGKWYEVMKDIDEEFTGSIEWDDEKFYYFEIEVDKACTLYLDNFCLNDGWAFTAPSGKLVIMHKESDDCTPSDGFPFYVTYTYDPFKLVVPQQIRDAVAQDAGIRLIDHLLGVRQAGIAFEYESDTMLSDSDKETLYARKTQLKREMKENLASYGYGWAGTVALP